MEECVREGRDRGLGHVSFDIVGKTGYVKGESE